MTLGSMTNVWALCALMACSVLAASENTIENLASKANVWASSEYNGSYAAGLAVDGKLSTEWAVLGTEAKGKAEFTLEWPQPVEVSEVVYWGRNYDMAASWKDYELYLDQEREPVVTGTFELTLEPQRIRIDTQKVRKIRLKFLNSHGVVNAGASEIGVYSTSPPYLLELRGQLIGLSKLQEGIVDLMGLKAPAKAGRTGYEHLQLSELTIHNTGQPRDMRFRMSVNGKFHSSESLGTIPTGLTKKRILVPERGVAAELQIDLFVERGDTPISTWKQTWQPMPNCSLKVPVAPFTYKMEWVGDGIKYPDYHCWSAWPILAPDGKFHVFGDRWPTAPGFSTYWYTAEITHYVSDKAEGPYELVDIPIKHGKPGDWDAAAIYPSVFRDGDRWVMFYTGCEHGGPDSTMKTGLAVSDSLYGPWKKIGIVCQPPEDPDHWTNNKSGFNLGIHCAVPVKFKGKWYLYFKGGARFQHDYLGVAVADKPEGPFKIADKPCILKDGKHCGTYLEDLLPLVWKDKVYLLVDDNFGGRTGVHGAVSLFESEDGLTFPYDKARLAVDLIAAYKAFDMRKTCGWAAGNCSKFEAPRLLWIDGEPKYFFGVSRMQIDGRPAASSYILKIKDWDLSWPEEQGGNLGRVAPGDCSPGAPADPDVQDYRIRFLK